MTADRDKERVDRLLDVLAAAHGTHSSSRTLDRLCERSGLNRRTAIRLLRDLVANGQIESYTLVVNRKGRLYT